ncbi:MAG: hypothetical protein MUP27_09170 [Desulfobacterales bacterium]|nr:hypothetical protein [Desulfobacterales bacterium]
MKPKQPEIKYEDYERLVFKIAWQWVRRTGGDRKELIQELIGEGNLAFVQARNKFQTFKNSKPCFSTYLVNFLEHRYIVLINGKHSQKRTFEPEDVELDSLPAHDSSPEKIVALKEMISQLSKDAQALVRCTLETPRDLVWMMGHHGHSVRISRYMLQRYFVRQKGWSISHFWDISKEIRQALATL